METLILSSFSDIPGRYPSQRTTAPRCVKERTRRRNPSDSPLNTTGSQATGVFRGSRPEVGDPKGIFMRIGSHSKEGKSPSEEWHVFSVTYSVDPDLSVCPSRGRPIRRPDDELTSQPVLRLDVQSLRM